MIRSMTGYGKSEAQLENGKLTVEIRSVNGKNADISIKTSLLPKDREMGIRKKIAESLQRGSIDMFLTWEPNAAEGAKTVNVALAKEYFSQIQALGSEIGAVNLPLHEPNYLMATLLRMLTSSTQKSRTSSRKRTGRQWRKPSTKPYAPSTPTAFTRGKPCTGTSLPGSGPSCPSTTKSRVTKPSASKRCAQG